MTMRPLLFLALSIALASCSHNVTRTVARAPHPSAVSRAMDRQVRGAVEVGDGDIETRRLRQRMATEPGNIEVRLDLASRYEASGVTELALEHYRLAAAQFPEHAGVQVLLARSLRAHGLSREAASRLGAYLTVRHDAPAELFSWLGILDDEIGEYEAGEAAHRRALQAAANKSQAYLHNNLGQNLLLQGRRTEAAAEFERALKLDQRSSTARNNLGIALAANPSEAVLHLQSITEPSTAHSNLAAVLIELGRYNEARQELNLALGYRRDNHAALRNLALLAQLDGKPVQLNLNSRPPGGSNRWGRFRAALGKVFVRTEDVPNRSHP